MKSDKRLEKNLSFTLRLTLLIDSNFYRVMCKLFRYVEIYSFKIPFILKCIIIVAIVNSKLNK